MAGWQAGKLVSFIILASSISFLFLRFIPLPFTTGFISQAESPKTPKPALDRSEGRDVFMETLNKSRRGLNDIELKGEEYYKHYCSICHGEEGRGDGFNSYNLNPKPKSFAEIIPSMDDEYLYKVISEGTASVGKTPLCPPRGLYLKHDTINAIVAYLRVQSKSL